MKFIIFHGSFGSHQGNFFVVKEKTRNSKTKSDFNSVSYVLYSDNDPYVDKKLSLDFAEKLGSKKILIRGGKHLNSEAGFDDFPLVFELCVKNLKIKNQNAK